ncbi:peptide chain release factor RF-2 [Glomus cerebriforme]|uniref:Peptide chain release factor RF-2 n=1 Tax=Glomus cerebriforme TaxID=658196 RepID=A0A397SH91_9GLOM|nr:peptide chain release factor RF-2 [Glomus cerebriforme]
MNLSLKILKDCIQNYTKSSLLDSSSFHYRFYQRIPGSMKVNGISDIMNDINKNLELLSRSKDWKVIKIESQKLQTELQSETLWNDSSTAILLQKKFSKLNYQIEKYERLNERVKNVNELAELANEENDLGLMNVVINDLKFLEKELKIFTLTSLMVEEEDQNGCIIQITPGAGGAESCDWSEMLLDMYEKWGIKSDYQVKLIDYVKGEIAGCKLATLQIDGEYAYGWCKHESGIHRLVRISPFDSQSRRHTSFASVYVFPNVNEDGSVDTRNSEIPSSDLKIESFRSSGPGGQHVNVTESGIRITHIPTKIVVQCQFGRSQHANKALAMTMLKAKLYDKAIKEKRDAKQEQYSNLPKNSWGSQIRSYVLYPYQFIKDVRTGFGTTKVDSVLNEGELNEFMEASLIYFNKKFTKKS